MLCKQESKGIPLSSDQDEWLQDTDEESDEQELEAHYMYMAKIQEVYTDDDYNVFANVTKHSEQLKSINDTSLVEKTDSNVTPNSSNTCDNKGKANQNVDEPENERVVLASLIANLKLDVDENKMKHKQLKKANTYLSQELEKIKQDLFYCRSELE
ncbi:hypothetical protein Tco_1484744 [Tanacetum coccineum]